MNRASALALILAVLGCAGAEDVLHFTLPEFGGARSMVLLVEDGESQNPLVYLTDIPFPPLQLDAELLSLESAQVEIALYSCPLAGLGLEAGRGRPGPREAESASLPVPSAVFRTTFSDHRAAEYRRSPAGERPTRIEARDLGLDLTRACPRHEVQRIPIAAEQGNVRLLGAFGQNRAVLQLEDGTVGLVDAEGLRFIESPFGEMRLWASATLPDQRIMVASEGGRSVQMGTLEEGFEPVAALIEGPGRGVTLSAARTHGDSIDVFALRGDSLQRFDGAAWSVTSSLAISVPEHPRLPSIAHVGPDEALFVHPSSRGVYRSKQGVLLDEPITYEEPDKRSSAVGYHSSYGGIVGGEDTSVRAQDADLNWVEIAPPLSRGQVRFVLELGRHVMTSDGQGTLHVYDPTLHSACADVAVSGSALGFGVAIEDGLFAVGSENHRPEPTLALVSFSNVMPLCDQPIDP